jgi:hypothetical protein
MERGLSSPRTWGGVGFGVVITSAPQISQMKLGMA